MYLVLKPVRIVRHDPFFVPKKKITLQLPPPPPVVSSIISEEKPNLDAEDIYEFAQIIINSKDIASYSALRLDLRSPDEINPIIEEIKILFGLAVDSVKTDNETYFEICGIRYELPNRIKYWLAAWNTGRTVWNVDFQLIRLREY